MRIAFVAPFGLRAKGTTRARVLPLAKALAKLDHSIAVFIPPYDSPKDSGKRWTDMGVEVSNVVLPHGSGGALWHLDLGWRLWRAVMHWQPEVVHVFKPKGPSGLAGTALRAVRSRARLVVDSDDWEGFGGWNDDPRAGYSPVQRRFFAWQERYGLSHADAWTVTSQCLRKRASGFGAPTSRVFIMHNGLADPAAWRPLNGAEGPAPGAVSARDVLLYTRFAGVRPTDVADIWGRVLPLVPGARLAVVGRGLGGEEYELARMVGNVDVLGWKEPDELSPLFAGMALGLVPWADEPKNRARHSAKVLEMMAAGIPIVGYDVGELAATVGDGGVLAPPGDAAAFAREVVAQLADPERAAQMGACARSRVETLFTWDRLAQVALTAYGMGRGG